MASCTRSWSWSHRRIHPDLCPRTKLAHRSIPRRSRCRNHHPCHCRFHWRLGRWRRLRRCNRCCRSQIRPASCRSLRKRRHPRNHPCPRPRRKTTDRSRQRQRSRRSCRRSGYKLRLRLERWRCPHRCNRFCWRQILSACCKRQRLFLNLRSHPYHCQGKMAEDPLPQHQRSRRSCRPSRYRPQGRPGSRFC